MFAFLQGMIPVKTQLHIYTFGQSLGYLRLTPTTSQCYVCKVMKMSHFLLTAVMLQSDTGLSPGDALTVASFSGISFIVTVTLAHQMDWRNIGICVGTPHAVIFPGELQTLYRPMSQSNQEIQMSCG